jgi:hypothetical protein
MATNASGWPYPVGTDAVRDGDNAIKAIADALMANIVLGYTSTAADALGAVTVSSIRAGETRPPRVVIVQTYGDDNGVPMIGKQNPAVRSMGPNTFSVRVWNTGTGSNGDYPVPSGTLVSLLWVALF